MAAVVFVLDRMPVGERSGLAAYDLCHRLAPGPGPTPRVVIVAIDERSIEELGPWPWPRSHHAKLLEILTRERVGAVGFDVLMPDESGDSEADEALARAAKAFGLAVFPFYAESKVLPVGSRVFHVAGARKPPYAALASAAAMGSVIAVPDVDGVLRRHVPAVVDGGRVRYSLDVEVVRIFLGLSSSQVSLGSCGVRLGSMTIPTDLTGRVLVRYSSGSPGGARYTTLPYYQVLRGEFAPGELQGKIVLVGVTAQGLHDFYFTPLATAGSPLPGVEIHANTVQAILEGLLVREPLEPLGALPLLVLSAALAAAFQGLRPETAAAVAGAGAACIVSSCVVLFAKANAWIDPVPFLAILFLVLGRHLVASYARAEAERARVRAALGRYLSPAVVDVILRAKGEEALGGRRLEVTILFADIRGFTSFAERESPERVVEVLNAYLSVMVEAIFREGGMLDKFTGDGVMAVFGAPVPQPDHAVRAARAAAAIVKACPRVAAKAAGAEDGAGECRNDVRLSVGVGVASGEAVVGNIGTVARMDYTAIGDVANLAARLEGMALPGQVLVCERAQRAIRGEMASRRVGSLEIRGRSAPVEVYELV
ncbi:MAG: adenylate/guanylate cyclase domain-containing protein [Firmicutes bacterium]|jgi:adenylate cyclase|nr:adenylate/guanylate cyclase domain-containing protein [Bacillota bacterium]MDH7495985.1 adenylate/guanylate cyclase domain-containing protein [Bacillota bacterium]